VHQELIIQPDRYAICRLPADAPDPEWPAGPIVVSVRREDELTVICVEETVAAGVVRSAGWAVLAVQGPLAHDLVGVLADLAQTLKDAEVPIFAVSTFDTDLILVPWDRIDEASAALGIAGHRVRSPA
jgi:hypothetical protein